MHYSRAEREKSFSGAEAEVSGALVVMREAVKAPGSLGVCGECVFVDEQQKAGRCVDDSDSVHMQTVTAPSKHPLTVPSGAPSDCWSFPQL